MHLIRMGHLAGVALFYHCGYPHSQITQSNGFASGFSSVLTSAFSVAAVEGGATKRPGGGSRIAAPCVARLLHDDRRMISSASYSRGHACEGR